MNTISLIVLLMIVSTVVTDQVQARQRPKSEESGVYSNLSLGFRYAPPSAMRDESEQLRSRIQEQEKGSGTAHGHAVLLAMFSGKDGSDPNWRSLTIETYPRSAILDADDASAEAKMSAWLAHSEDASPSSNDSVVVSGQKFSVSLFAVQDGPTRKGASVWTTVRKGKLLSFFFAANSPEQLKALTETMKTVQFY